MIVALFLVFGAAACGGSKSSSSSGSEGTTSTTIGGTQVESHGTKDVSTASGKVEIEIYDNYFEPTVLKGKPGQMVEPRAQERGQGRAHVHAASAELDKEIQPGDEGEVEVTFPQSGELKFVCKFHAEPRHDRRPPGVGGLLFVVLDDDLEVLVSVSRLASKGRSVAARNGSARKCGC